MKPAKRASTKAISFLSICLMTFLFFTSASAMGSGNAYIDAQTGLTYSLYKPTNTLGLTTSTFQLLVCGGGGEEWTYSSFSKGKKKLEIMQTMAGQHCSDPGLSVRLPSVKIDSRTVSVFAYCDPTNSKQTKTCSTKDILRFGGYLYFTAPGKFGMKPTSIQVQGSGGITYSQLIQIARSLTPVMGTPAK